MTLALLLAPATRAMSQGTDPQVPGQDRRGGGGLDALSAGAAVAHQPTEYEKAMLHRVSLEGRGLHWASSAVEQFSHGLTSGAALLSTLLPGLKDEDEDGEEGRVGPGVALGGGERGRKLRRLQTAYPWRFFGVDVTFNSGPTLGALNASFYRYDSVVPDPVGVDWRLTPFMTPVQVQFDVSHPPQPSFSPPPPRSPLFLLALSQGLLPCPQDPSVPGQSCSPY